MKTIIVEGCDRTGKDLICNYIKTISHNLLYRHWGKPIGENIIEQQLYQRSTFFKEFGLRKSLIDDKYFNRQDIETATILWNRSHIGEFVYGNLYREDEADWIFNIEELFGIRNSETYLILLEGDAEFLCHNDDGESYTNNIEKKKIELELFNKAFEKSNIPHKLKIKINEGNKYRSATNIQREVREFIYNSQLN